MTPGPTDLDIARHPSARGRVAYADAVRRAMTDPRLRAARPVVREMVLASLTVLADDPAAGHDGTRFVDALTRLMPKAAILAAVHADRPRYAPEMPSGCAHLLTAGPREGDPCDARPVTVVSCPQPDGTRTLAGYCTRHRRTADIARAHAASIAYPDAPPPVPNRGGLLAAHLPAFDWRVTYRTGMDRDAPDPPEWAYGVNADEWPTGAALPAPEPEDAPEGAPERPVLRVIPGHARPDRPRPRTRHLRPVP